MIAVPTPAHKRRRNCQLLRLIRIGFAVEVTSRVLIRRQDWPPRAIISKPFGFLKTKMRRELRRPYCSCCTKSVLVFSKVSASATLSIKALLSMRRMKPLKAVPGPSSIKRVNPCESRYRIDSSHRTEEVTCCTSSSRISAGAPCGRAVTFEITCGFGADTAVASNIVRSPGCALEVSLE